MASYCEFSHWKRWFSIAMLNYKRINICTKISFFHLCFSHKAKNKHAAYFILSYHIFIAATRADASYTWYRRSAFRRWGNRPRTSGRVSHPVIHQLDSWKLRVARRNEASGKTNNKHIKQKQQTWICGLFHVVSCFIFFPIRAWSDCRTIPFTIHPVLG